LRDYQILAIPGGFSFGDDIGAGKVLATKIKYNLAAEFSEFIKKGKLIIGICNGFQVLVKLGILPGFNGNYDRQEVTLTFNDSGRFEDRWVCLKINQKSKCIWTRGIERLYLPARHGEGKFVSREEKIRERLISQNRIVAQYMDDKGNLAGYPWNPNGSELNIAGICDETGRIFGLMPHPEAFLFPQNHPRWTREKIQEGEGLKIFKNAINFVKNKL
ncbi:MAG: phosphoribosylformylglycinamidine synthase, partial [Candidatus Nealsonbacteria bacterium CG15_BIG_FIL_POST_REV_8_21_14_020_37_12]